MKETADNIANKLILKTFFKELMTLWNCVECRPPSSGLDQFFVLIDLVEWPAENISVRGRTIRAA